MGSRTLDAVLEPRPVSMKDRLATDYHWSMRQREVLSLLAKGKSNQEVADVLGISLDGAKWHVSQILGELQAADRQEAADYWRRYTGLTPRFGRTFRALVGATDFKAAFAVVSIGGVVLFGVLLVGLASNSNEASPPPPTVAPTESIVPTNTPLPRQIELASPVELPPNTLVYYLGSGRGNDDGQNELFRAYRLSSGRLVVQSISAMLPTSGQFVSAAVDAPSGRIAVVVCLEGYCGPYGPAEPRSIARLWLSPDGGVTWTGNDFPVDSSLIGFTAAELAVYTAVQHGPEAEGRVWLFPSENELVAAEGGVLAGDFVTYDGQVLRLASDGGLDDVDGMRVVAPPLLPGKPHWQSEDGLASSREQLASGELRWWAALLSNGASGVTWPSNSLAVDPVRLLSSDISLVNLRMPTADDDRPSIGLIDFSTGTVAEITSLSKGDMALWAVGAFVGRLGGITGSSKCVDILAVPAPSATSVGCASKGELVQIDPDASPRGGFVPVRTWAGVTGWVLETSLDW